MIWNFFLLKKLQIWIFYKEGGFSVLWINSEKRHKDWQIRSTSHRKIWRWLSNKNLKKTKIEQIYGSIKSKMKALFFFTSISQNDDFQENFLSSCTHYRNCRLMIWIWNSSMSRRSWWLRTKTNRNKNSFWLRMDLCFSVGDWRSPKQNQVIRWKKTKNAFILMLLFIGWSEKRSDFGYFLRVNFVKFGLREGFTTFFLQIHTATNNDED